MRFSHNLSLVFALGSLAISLPLLGAERVAFTYLSQEKQGGLASLEIGEEGFAGSAEILAADLQRPFKVAVSASRQTIAAVAGGKDAPEILWISADGSPARRIPIEAEISDVAFVGESLLVAAGKGRFNLIEPPGEIRESLRARQVLQPPGHKGEHLLPLDRHTVLVSFQKDDPDTDALGNRLAVLEIDPLRFTHDILLREALPQVEFPAELQAAILATGPTPEVLTAFPAAKTVTVTLDAYGAILFASLPSLLEGRLAEISLLPAAPAGNFGTAFPDRVLGFTHADRPVLLVSNAAAANQGGALVFYDVLERERLAAYPMPCGAEIPVQTDRYLATVLSGKTKFWQNGQVASKRRPARELIGLVLPPSSEPITENNLEKFSLPLPMDPVAIVGLKNDRVIVLGRDENRGEALLIDLPARTILARAPLPGAPVRAKAW